MALIDDQQEIIWKIVDQAVGRFPRTATVEMTGIVLDALATARLRDHLHIVQRALPESVSLDHAERGQLLLQLSHNGLDGCLLLLFRDHIMPGRIDEEVVHILFDLAGLPVNLGDPLHLIPK